MAAPFLIQGFKTKGKNLTEIRVEISEKASGSMVTFLRDPDTNRVIVLLRLRPAMPVEEFVHEAVHVVQAAKAIEAGRVLTFDLATELEKEAARWTCSDFPEI